MELLQQLLAYGWAGWTAFLLGAWLLPRRRGWPGLFIAHFLIGLTVYASDSAWVRESMDQPDWGRSGTPDLDGIFVFGCIARIVTINLLVTPLALLAVHRHKRDLKPHQAVSPGVAR